METKNCQNCKKDFIIGPEDFSFYEKIKVPPPTFCPECRMIRRMVFRNERSLYKTACVLCSKNMISMYAPEKPHVVYCNSCYSSDDWDPMSYGFDLNFKESFFKQLHHLMQITPRRNLYQDFAERSEYTNQLVYVKNSYLCFGGRNYEDCAYCAQNFDLQNCIDVDFSSKCEYCFASFHLKRSSRLFYSSYSEDCIDSWFLYGCKNCSDCIGCTNLRNKSHCIFNEQYSKEAYDKKKTEFMLDTQKGIAELDEMFVKYSANFPRKFAYTRNAVNSTGDDLEQVKDCIRCFSASGAENCRYSFFMPYGIIKDTYDVDHVGVGTSDSYEIHSGFGDNRVFFSNRVYFSHDVYYSDDCYNCEYLFGCVSLRKKSYCIFNKQYTKEEYNELVSKIISAMNENKYIESNGAAYAFGEFFPSSISPFSYNETVAQEYFTLSQESVEAKSHTFRSPEKRDYKVEIQPENLPDIKSAEDSIVNSVIGCKNKGSASLCTTAFRMIPTELIFYKRFNIPLPDTCPNCRHADRISKMNPLKLWHRKCVCEINSHGHNASCKNEFETPYSPERNEIVYCESCYQKEVL